MTKFGVDKVELEAGHRQQPGIGVVGRHPDERRFRRGGDLACLPDAAAMSDIGLQHVGRAKRQDVAEAPLGEHALARGHRDRDRRGDLGQRPRVLRQNRLLEEKDVKLVQRLRHLDRRRRREATMAVDQDVDVRADGIPDQLQTAPRLPQLVLPGHAGHGVEGDQL